MDRKRHTVQQQIVLDALTKMNTHPAVDDIYVAIHAGHPSISKATVYRNLRQLAAGGIIRQITLPDGLQRYDARTDEHYHFKCDRCGAIYDVDIPYLDGIDDCVRQKYGIMVERHDVVFSGVCQMCGDITQE